MKFPLHRSRSTPMPHLIAGLAVTLLCVALPARAIDGMAIVAGSGDSGDNLDMLRVAAQWEWDKRWFDDGDWYLGGYWELDAGYWDAGGQNTANDSLVDIGFTPVFRFQSKSASGMRPYIEGGIGIHLISETRINNKDMSTELQFGDHIGAGIRFGDRLEWDLGYRYQHFSNAGIEKPNPGVDVHQIRLGYRFD